MDERTEQEYLLEIALLHRALLRAVAAIPDPAVKAEIADLLWPPAPTVNGHHWEVPPRG